MLDSNDDATLTGGAPGAPGAGGEPPFTPAQLVYIQSLRRESASHRTENKALKAMHAAEVRALKVDLAFHQSPEVQGLDLKYIKWRMTEEKLLDDLDPSAPNFGETLHDRLSAFVGKNPELRVDATRQVPPTTMGVPAGGGIVGDQLTMPDWRALSDEQKYAAFKQGRANWLLGKR